MSNDQNYSLKNIKQHFEDLEFWSFDVFSFIYISITLDILIILEV